MISTTEIRNNTYQSIKPDILTDVVTIYEFMSSPKYKPMTRTAIAEALGMPPVTVRARISNCIRGNKEFKYPEYEMEQCGVEQYVNSRGRLVSPGLYQIKIKTLFN